MIKTLVTMTVQLLAGNETALERRRVLARGVVLQLDRSVGFSAPSAQIRIGSVCQPRRHLRLDSD